MVKAKLLAIYNLLFNRTQTLYGDEAPSHRAGEWEMDIGFYQAIELIPRSLLYQVKSEFQNIQVHQSKFYGKVLLLDDRLQLTERDADSYNEMMAHVPMFQHPNPKRVLIIGGGDGYALKEVLKHESVEHVDHVDLDKEVIATCEQYFPQWATGWKDPRVQLHIQDGAVFIQDIPDASYDVIIQDSSDPFEVIEDGSIKELPSGALYTEEHFRTLKRILTDNGILMIQSESFSIPSALQGISLWRTRMINCEFERTRYGSIYTSSYPTGQIGFLLAEKKVTDASSPEAIQERYNQIVEKGTPTSYYHPPLQTSCFDLPLWVHNSVYSELPVTDNSKAEL